MKIKSIISQLDSLRFRVGSSVTLGMLGTSGIFQNTESLQIGGLAVAMVSTWYLARTGVNYIRDKKNKTDLQTESENKSTEESLKKDQVRKEHYELAKRYQQGIGVNSDYSRAFEHYYEGAKLGSLDCAAELGTFYEFGKGIPQNNFLAQYWYEEGAFGENPASCFYLARWYLRHRRDKKAQRRVVYFLDVSCMHGFEKALELRKILINSGKYTNNATENKLLNMAKSKMFDYASHPALRKFIFRGGTSKPSEIASAYKMLGFKLNEDGTMPDLDISEIRKSYHYHVRKLHPDKTGQPSSEVSEKLTQLRIAFELLFRLNSH